MADDYSHRSLSPQQVDVQIREVEKLKTCVAAMVNELKNAHPDWDDATDLRLTAFTYVVATLGCIHLCLVFLRRDMHDPRFWQEMRLDNVFGRPKPDALLRQFESFVFSTLIVSVVATFESVFRVILRALDADACDEGRGDFRNIYVCLLSSHITSGPPESIALLDILRHQRNTIHNAGIHLTRRGVQQVPIVYKGKEYSFVDGRLVSIYLETLFSLLNDAVDLLFVVISDEKVIALSGNLDDPTNKEYRAIERGEGHPPLG